MTNSSRNMETFKISLYKTRKKIKRAFLGFFRLPKDTHTLEHQLAVREIWILDNTVVFGPNFSPKTRFFPPFSLITKSVLKKDPFKDSKTAPLYKNKPTLSDV